MGDGETGAGKVKAEAFVGFFFFFSLRKRTKMLK